MPKLRIAVRDADAAIVAALSFLEHHEGWEVATYCAESLEEALDRRGLNPVVCEDLEARAVQDALEEGGFTTLLSEGSLTKATVPQLHGDRERSWDIAVRPRRPFALSPMGGMYATSDPEFPRQRTISDRYFSGGMLGINGHRLSPGDITIEPGDWLEQMNSQLAECHMGLLPGRAMAEPEVTIHRHVEPAALLRHQSRLCRAQVVHYPAEVQPWKPMPMRLLVQLNLADYLAACRRYEVSEARIRQVEDNLVRYRSRFGDLGDQFAAIYHPQDLD